MSITVSDGSAQAIEYGISTEVTIRPSTVRAPVERRPRARGPEVHPSRTRSVSCGHDLARQAEVDVFARDLDLRELAVAGGGELRHDRLDELFRRGSARGQADRAVAVEQIVFELALAVDQRRGGAIQASDLDEPLRVRAGLRPD